MNTDKYVGLDVHKVDTQVVIATDGRDGDEARSAEMAQPEAKGEASGCPPVPAVSRTSAPSRQDLEPSRKAGALEPPAEPEKQKESAPPGVTPRRMAARPSPRRSP